MFRSESYCHTHFLQGNVPVKRFKETSLRHYEKNSDGTIKLYALINHEYCVSGTYSGYTNSSLTFKLQGEYDYQETQGDTYYPKSQYSALKEAYETATRKYYHAQDFKFGLTTKTIYAYRTGDRRVVLTDSYPGGSWVD